MSDFSEAREKRYVGLTRETNPHIPKYLNSSPWYLNDEKQISDKNSTESSILAANPAKKQTPASKYRPGACTNCGGMGHKAKNCIERPRKKGAKYTGQDIMPDIQVADSKMSYDSKRDRYNGYDENDYKKVIEKFEERVAKGEVSDAKLKAQKDELLHKVGYLTGDSDKTGDLYGDEPTKSRRDRNDKAHYLDNFSTEGISPLFHPKNATGRQGEVNEEGQFIPKLDQDALAHKRRLQEADSAEVQQEINPTASILALSKADAEERMKRQKLQSEVLGKYGGTEYMNQHRPVELGIMPIENKIKTSDMKKITIDSEKDGLSIYEEDIYPGNHTSIWGSYYNQSKWGYACCHSLTKQSYCVGEKGKQLNKSD